MTPPRPPKSATTKHNELAAECRRYHAQTQQHSDVLDAQGEKYIKTYVFYQRKWSLTAWGLDGSAPTLTKSRACAQKKMAKSVPGPSEEDETIYIRDSMEEDKALLETCA